MKTVALGSSLPLVVRYGKCIHPWRGLFTHNLDCFICRAKLVSLGLLQEGRTPLLQAAAGGHAAAIEALVDKGAQIEAKDNVRQSFLYLLHTSFVVTGIISGGREGQTAEECFL